MFQKRSEHKTSNNNNYWISNAIAFTPYNANRLVHWEDQQEIESWVDLQAAKSTWSALGDIPVDEDGEYTEEDFLHFPAGSEVLDIWHWIEHKFDISIGETFFN